MPIKEILDQYRPNVGIVLFNRDGRVFLGRRASDFVSLGENKNDWLWQLPQGGIDESEDVAAAAFRELKEETGIVTARLLALTPGWVAYDFPAGYKKKSWRGQRQKWAAMLFEGEDAEIDLQADDHQEFNDWRWAALEETPDLIVPFKREVYRELVTAFAPLRDYIRASS